ncbi:SPASM domain-containing protein [Parasphingorhabdus sp.]|uniref:radical SAM/SPASM domain-containing protein n=1 Tax=Parasphingorhabdus sp. TaxID=2709688 RepID=UPI002B26C3C2|nr:SPASM domain-containing protein [Parasphingorhabdus sp.]
MSLDLFKSCIDKLPDDVTVDFTGFYEPFLNPQCTDMILYAAEKGLPVRLSTTVMGLEPEQVDRIKHIAFVKFAVHLPDTKKLTRIIVDERYMATLSRLTESAISNIGYHVHEGLNGPEAVHGEVDALLTARNIEPENRWVNTRAGNIELDGQRSPERLVGELAICPRLYHNVLLPSGDVALCCMDWDLKHMIGNLLEQSYESLFESQEFKTVMRGYADDSIDILCRGCEVARTKKETLFREVVSNIKAKRSVSSASERVN